MNKFLAPIIAQGPKSRQEIESLFNSFATQPNTELVEARSPRPQLCIMPVPQSLVLAPRDLCYLTVAQEGRRWCYPLQFTRQKLTSLLPEIKHLNWGMPDKVPESPAALHEVVEHLRGGEQ